MPAPGSFVDWDTNATNTAAITSGHALDDFANNEIPTSRELNQVLMLIGLWIRYLAKREATVRRIPAATGNQILASGSTGSFNESGQWFAGNTADRLVVAIDAQPGEHLTEVRGFVHDFTGQGFSMKVWKTVGGSAAVQLGTTQTSPGVAGEHTLTVTGLDETIGEGDNTTYVATFYVSGLAGAYVENVEITYDVPAV
jgi:hypothetical protein